MNKPKPIETLYQGYRFRSRLEARWAMFYDALGVRWRYEWEGYDLGDGVYYLPDFYFPDLDLWIEVKGKSSAGDEVHKAKRLCEATGQRVYIFFGDIPYVDGYRLKRDWGSAFGFFPDGACSLNHHWCECLVCGKFGIEPYGAGHRICDEKCSDGAIWHTYATPRLQVAYRAARSARFEHDERWRG